jgi:2-methylcitrate dehydratase PrpD
MGAKEIRRLEGEAGSMDLAERFAKYALGIAYEAIPAKTIATAKKFFLDTLGVGLAGSSAAGVNEVVDLVREWGGRPESTIMVFGEHGPSPLAALANSVMFHARDFDDTHDAAVVHANTPVLPAILAVAEKRGSVDGKELIAAACASIDIACRLGMSIGRVSRPTGIKWIRTAVCGAFGAVVGAGRVMGLDSEGLLNAMGILLSSVAGTRQVVTDSALTKRMQPGLMCQAAVQAVHLAARGVRGCRQVFEGPYGFFRLYWDNLYDAEVLTDGLGTRFEVDGLSFKPYPCCRYTHGAIDAALGCMKRHKIPVERVDRVHVHVVNHSFYDMVSRPFEIRGNPTVDGQFSIPYTVAAAILDGKVFIDSFDPGKVTDPRYGEMAGRVFVHRDLECRGPGTLGPVTVEIGLQDGTCVSETILEFKGHPDNPMNSEECRAKFMQCAEYAARPFPQSRLEAIVDRVGSLEGLRDTRELMRMLVP